MTTGKNIFLTTWTFVSKVMSLLFNMLSRLVIAFLPRSKCLLISCLQSPMILEPKKDNPSLLPLFPFYLLQSDGTSTKILVFWMLSFKTAFSLSSFTLIKRLLISSSLSAIRVHLHIWGCWYVSQQSWFQLGIHPVWHFTNDNLLQYSCLKNPMDRGTWWASMGSQRVKHD